MIDTTYFRWGPSNTPTVIRWIILISTILSLTSALTHNLFIEIFGWKSLQEIFSLSWKGLRNYYLWQPFTYPFIQESGYSGIGIYYLITLAFNMYVLWVVGTMLHERTGTKKLLGLFFTAAVLTGLTTILMMPVIGQYQFLFGPAGILLSFLTVWAMYYPENELFFLFLFPLRPKGLLLTILGIVCFLSLANLDIISIVFYLSAVFIGYLYGLLFLDLPSPYSFTQSFDRFVLKWKNKILKRQERDQGPKIVDISSGTSSDDAFVDAMLTKISKYGESSLTPRERQRLQQISERKMR